MYHGGRRNNSQRMNRKLQNLHLNTRKCCFSSLLGVFVYLLVLFFSFMFVHFHSTSSEQKKKLKKMTFSIVRTIAVWLHDISYLFDESDYGSPRGYVYISLYPMQKYVETTLRYLKLNVVYVFHMCKLAYIYLCVEYV